MIMDNVRELYVVKDVVAEQFGPIYEAPNIGVAQRNFRNLIKDTACPNDFELYRIGYLDDKMNLIPEIVCFTDDPETMLLKTE